MRISNMVVAAIVSLAGCMGSVAESGQGTALDLEEGRRAVVSGTDLTIEVAAVRNLTAQGCLGGPTGCPDSVEIVVARGQESQRVVLHLPRTSGGIAQGVNRVRLFGYTITLVGIEASRARFMLQASAR